MNGSPKLRKVDVDFDHSPFTHEHFGDLNKLLIARGLDFRDEISVSTNTDKTQLVVVIHGAGVPDQTLYFERLGKRGLKEVSTKIG
jgi:hypothetical protein